MSVTESLTKATATVTICMKRCHAEGVQRAKEISNMTLTVYQLVTGVMTVITVPDIHTEKTDTLPLRHMAMERD